MDAPSDAMLAGFCAGTLEESQALAVETWLATLPEDRQQELLERHGIDRHRGALGATPRVEPPRTTWDLGAELGRGGMGTVYAARDRQLDRDIAVKVLHPRRAEESLEAFLLRQAAFHREASTVAGLDHPGIIPVYGAGQVDGQPAFAMKRLTGRTLGQLLVDGRTPPLTLIDLLRQAAAAAGHAHARGVVHRDLTPDNLVVEETGGVLIVDWGLAGRLGATEAQRVGTPGWLAPEQDHGAAPDPRMDVYTLGKVLDRILGGAGPAALRAVVDRCAAADPDRRYPDGRALADELGRWQAEGLTLALDLGPWERAWVRLRRSPRVRRGLGLAAMAAVVVGGTTLWTLRTQDQVLTLQAQQLARAADLADAPAIDRALHEVGDLLVAHPHHPALAIASARLEAARAVRREAARAADFQRDLNHLLAEVRRRSTWDGEFRDWGALLGRAGITVAGTDQPPAAGAPAPAEGSLPADLAEAIVFAWRAGRQVGQDAAADHLARLLAERGPDQAWQAFGRLLGNTVFRAHDPVFCHCPDSDVVLGSPATTAVLLAIYAPEPRLVAAAEALLTRDPGAFWPLITVARAAQAAGDWPRVQRLALIASGAEPGSVRPSLLLAYAALGHSDWAGLDSATARGLAIHPDHSELLVLRAIALARAGDSSAGQALLARVGYGHLNYHLEHPQGHPMELGVRGALAAGLTIPAAPPALGPVGLPSAEPEHHHHP